MFFTTRPPRPLIDAPDDRPEPDPLGLHAWAGEQGISPAAALLLASTTLAHVAGPTLWWDGTPLLSGKPAPSLVGAVSDVLLGSALGRLVSHLNHLQQRLEQSSHEFPVELVDREYLKGCDTMYTAKFTSMLNEDAERLKRPAYELEQEQHALLESGFRFRHRESLLFPLFMADSLPPGQLAEFLFRFNHGACFLAGGLTVLPSDTAKRHQRIDDLTRYLDGAIVEPRHSSVVRTKHVRLGGILRFRQEDLHWLMDERRDFVGRLIPVASNPPDPDLGCEIDPEKVRLFQSLIHRTARHSLALRRSFFPSDADFRCEDAQRDFLARRRLYRLRTANAPTDLYALPDLLMWFLLRLDTGYNEQALVDLAMETADTLFGEACGTFALHDNMQLGLMRQRNARKMLSRISERGPLKRHLLVRIFNKQNLDLHAPVIDALLAHGFLREDDNQLLHVGPVPPSRLTMEHLLPDFNPAKIAP